MGDPTEDDARADAAHATSELVEAREALIAQGALAPSPGSPADIEARRRDAGHRQGDVDALGASGWGTQVINAKARGEWHGTRDGKGCDGVPHDGVCPKCGARLERERDMRERDDSEVKVEIELDARQRVTLDREEQRRAISRDVLARFLKKNGLEEVRDPKHVAEYDALVRSEYKRLKL